MTDTAHVQLGRHALPCYPQTWTRIVKRLGRLGDAFTGAITEEGFDGSKLVGSLGDRIYDALVAFIPNLPERMPEYEFHGYGSREAYDSDDYDERQDNAPTFPQFLDAFDVIIEVNGGKRFMDALGKVFPAEWVRAKLAEAIEDTQDRLSGSPSLPPTNGTSRPTSSTTSDPTVELLASAEPSARSANSSGIPLSV